MSGFIFTSESVSMGHPDKVSDQVSDAVLDALLAQDPKSRVACETLCTTDFLLLAGEITSKASVDYEQVARDTVRDIGYTSNDIGFNADSCTVDVKLHQQSPDIAQGVDADGAGDQGLMFGYACNQTEEYMPLPIALSHRILNRLTEVRQNGEVDWLLPDSKSQVSVKYEDGKPVGITAIVVSTQHKPSVEQKEIAAAVINKVIKETVPQHLLSRDTQYHINPTGRFVVGGPHGDCGLTGRKIIVDTYGGWGRHGGGAFSGKDSTKVDRSAAYMARYIAKNIVAAGLATDCEIQLAYAIGVADPVSVCVDTRGTADVSEEKIAEAVREIFLPAAGHHRAPQVEEADLRKTAWGVISGRNDSDFTWEATDSRTSSGRGTQ
ncbi:MAG: methionine adenosyltransferase [Planctomycetaceae bacterium]